jgi:hypothetical protein
VPDSLVDEQISEADGSNAADAAAVTAEVFTVTKASKRTAARGLDPVHLEEVPFGLRSTLA